MSVGMQTTPFSEFVNSKAVVGRSQQVERDSSELSARVEVVRDAITALRLVAVSLLIVLGGDATSQTDRRALIGPHHVDAACNVQGFYTSFQAVCDARKVAINWQGDLIYYATHSYKGQCRSTRQPPDVLGYPMLGYYCPPNYSMKSYIEYGGCNHSGYQPVFYGPDQYCQTPYPIFDEDRRGTTPSCPDGKCELGNPIDPIRGVKHERVSTGLRLGQWELEFHYNSLVKAPMEGEEIRPADPTPRVLGPLWSSSFHRKFIWQSHGGSGHGNKLHARGDGRVIQAKYESNYTSSPDVNDRALTSARYVDASMNSLEYYTGPANTVASMWAGAGGSVTMTYSTSSTPTSIAPAAGYLISASDHTGRKIDFRYESPVGAPADTGGRLVQVLDNAGNAITIGYHANGNVAQIVWADGRTRQYVYENAAIPWALTGVVDELGVRYATFGYDGQGRAVSTEHAGGVDRYAVSHTVPPKVVMTETLNSAGYLVRTHDWAAPQETVVTDPLGNSRNFGSAVLHGKVYMTSRSQPACSGCAASTMTQTFDANGNLASKDDVNGNRSCRVNDLSRNVETVRVDGLTATVACSSVTSSGATLPVGSRKSSTQWHPNWRLKTKIAEARRITTHVYNGQPDPFNGSAIATCAPTAATLPDGMRIAVLCKKVEQSTNDVDGSQGFSATIDASVANRTWQWTYNEHGQVLTERDPLNNQGTNVYYTTTTADYTKGDLQTSTNPAGHVTSYPRYNKHGQVLQKVDPNGIVTDYTYDLRQRLKNVTTGGQTTSYDYDAAGQLKKATQPDGSYVAYDYDAAHRLIAVSDSVGNRIDYKLDNAGNRTAENVKDPSGALKRQLARAMDALGRVQQTTGRE